MELGWIQTRMVTLRTARRRPVERAAPQWVALAPVDLTDAEATRVGHGRRLAEAEQIRDFLRAGGAAIVRR